jgi:uncharacterized membrane protein
MGISRKIYWLPLLVVGLTAILSPCSILAQAGDTGLTLRIASDNYYDSLTAGQEKTIFLEIQNNSNTELTNIRLSADSPKGWTVEFNPGFIDKLEPGGFQTVDVILRPAKDTAKGGYNVTLIADSNETRRVLAYFVNVESASLLWVWIGIGLGVLVIGGFAFIFIRFGRQ